MKVSSDISKFFITTCIIFIILAAVNVKAADRKNEERNIIRAEQIDRMNVSRIEEILDTFPGVSSSAAGTTIAGSSDIIVQVDGRSIKDPISGRIKWDQISLNNIGSIEVITSGGSRYGGETSGGVILITSRTSDTFSGNLETAAGNMNFKRYRGDIQTSINDLKIGITGSYDSDDGWRENEHTIVSRAGLNFSYESGPDFAIAPSFNYFKQIKGLAGPYFAPTPYNEGTFESLSANIAARFRGLNSRTIFTDSSDRSIDAHPAPIPHNIKISPSVFSQEFTSDFNLQGSGTINAGTGFENARIGVETNIDDIQLPDALYKERKAWGFAAYNVSWVDNRYSMYLGLRGTYYNNFDNSLNPEFNIGYKEERYGATIGFSIADRLPSYKNRYLSDAFMVANPDLGKEQNTNYNVSFYFNPHNTFSLNMTPFYSKIDDMISSDTVITEEGPRRFYINVGGATIKGFDTAATWEPMSQFNMSLSYTLQSARDDETDLWMPMRPKHRFQGRVNFMPIDRLSMSTTVNWVSKEYGNRANTISVGSWYEVAARIEYSLNRYLFFFQIDNMFDRERIRPFLIPAVPRFFYTGVRFTF